MSENKEKVVIGMSGGVDSSVAAYLLKEAGYQVIGVTMQMWGSENAESIADAKKIAEDLKIPHYVLDFRKEFKEEVIRYFMEEYAKGRTPNPCVICNRKVKWEALLAWAQQMDAYYIATGHYARVERLENGRFAIKKSSVDKKDQTYALFNLTQEQLAHTKMPIGEYEKEKVREIAVKIGLTVAGKPDSQEICFIPDHDYAGYIERESGKHFAEGNFVAADGTALGRHQGIIHYTIGQRKGLGLAMGKPVFVTKILPQSNEVVIGSNEELFTTRLTAEQMNYMAEEKFFAGMEMTAKIRYAHKGERCRVISCGNDRLEIEFDYPVRAITPGQAVVFYKGDYVLGGGLIR